MVLTYLAPPLLAIFGSGTAQVARARGLGADGHRISADVAVLPAVPFVGCRAACYCLAIYALHPRFRLSICARTGRKLEGARASQRIGTVMITAAEARSGKGHRDENFPVASRLIHPRHRAPILAFYEFVRTADDIADHPSLAPQEKLALLDRLEATLLGKNDDDPVGVALRAQLAARALSPRHAQDLLHRVPHGRDQAALPRLGRSDRLLHAIRPCRSAASCSTSTARAAPPGPPTTRCARRCRSSTICRIAARTIAISTASTFRSMPWPKPARPWRRSAPITPRRRCSLASASSRAAPAGLLRDSRPFSAGIDDIRLALEVAVIQTFAERLVGLLGRRDPLSERVHLGKAGVAGFGLLGLLWGATRRVGRVFAAGHKPQDA